MTRTEVLSNPAYSSKLEAYKELSKFGIVVLVLVTVLGGYLCGHPFEEPLHVGRLFLTLLGVGALGAGSSALNQYQERAIDATMPRTAGRPLPSGFLTPAQALNFISVALVLGLGILFWLSTSVGLLGVAAVLSYNILYTLWWKKKWAFAAVPGAIPGALPALIGYTAASGQVWTSGGLYLFFILFFWQMPHFWVLALKYKEDYAAGGFPTLPVAHGLGVTVSQIVVWCLAYVALALGAPLFLRVGSLYLAATLIMSLKVLWELRAFVKEPESKRWLHFFLWVNFSQIVYVGAAVADLWSIYLIRYFTR
ncbi:MAG: protoheme IX farnesyltransferase [Methylotenera sp.]|nr:protoheme IX farnesyltransferase [Oligoflexia bacterium]